MKEILVELGLKPSVWLMSMMVACLMAFYRIFEKEPLPGRREIILIVIGAVVCVILVPGLVYYAFKIDNPFLIAGATAICVHSFEKYLRKAQKRFDEQLNILKDGEDN